MVLKGYLEHELNVLNWYLMPYSPSENNKNFKYELLITRKEKALVLFTDSEILYQKMLEGLEKYCVRVNMQNEYEFQGSAHSVNKKEFIFMKNKLTKDRVIGKFMKKSSVTTKEQISNFLNELHILRMLNNKNVLSFCAIFEEENYFILLFEKLKVDRDYINLNFFLKTKASMEEIAALKLAEDLINAVQYLHKKQSLLHNFVKEENILIYIENGYLSAKIFNFCYSKRISQYHAFTKEIELSTYPGYVCPELVTKKNDQIIVTEALDVYALGCVLFRTFTGLSAAELAKNNYCLPLDSVKHLSPLTIELLDGFTNKEPQKRITLGAAKKLVQECSNQLLGLKVPEFQLINNRLKANIRTLSSISLNSGFANSHPNSINVSQNLTSIFLDDQKNIHNEIQGLFWGSNLLPSIIQETDTNAEKSETMRNRQNSHAEQSEKASIKLPSTTIKFLSFDKDFTTKTMDSIPQTILEETPHFRMEMLHRHELSKKFIPFANCPNTKASESNVCDHSKSKDKND